jgi:hypothetical protein
MNDDFGIPRIAHRLADPARARILWTLIDGTTRPAGDLAYAANISAQSAHALPIGRSGTRPEPRRPCGQNQMHSFLS